MKSLNRLKWVLITLGYVSIIFLLSFRVPGSGKYSLLKEIANNLAHIPLYAGLGYLVLIMLKHFRVKKMLYFATITFTMCIAVLDELFQSFVPGRSVDVRDIILDFIGVCLAVFIYKTVRGRNKSKRKEISLGETGDIF